MPLTTGKGIIVYASTSTLHADTIDWISRVIAAGGTVSTPRQSAVNTLVLDSYTAGLRDSVGSNHIIQYCLPFAVDPGSPVAAVFEPLWKPSGVSGVANGLSSGAYSNSGYAFSGSNYFDTGFNLQSRLTNTAHFSVFISSLTLATTSESIGANNSSSSQYFQLYYGSGSTYSGVDLGDRSSYLQNINSSNLDGYTLVNRNGTTLKWLNDGTLFQSSTNSEGNSSTLPDLTFYLGARNNAGSPFRYTNDTYSFLTLGQSLTTTQEASANSITQAFRSAIGAL